ncbi:MAG: hypothetical protein U0L88_05245 [Acutalibacteraceae bacterium]|nr:hypothetical protein [Acutalibacteraceae bacterium]
MLTQLVAQMVEQTFYEILAMLIIAIVAINRKKIAEWERRVWAKFKKWLRTQLRKSDKIVAWAEKPTKHGTPDMAWIEGQVKVYGDEWR